MDDRSDTAGQRRQPVSPRGDGAVAALTPDEVDAFLAEPRDAVLSVVLPSGRAMGTPIWFRWVDGIARFQSPTTSAKTAALRATGRASLCVHDQPLPIARYVTLEGPVREVEFDLDADIGAAAHHYLGDGAAGSSPGSVPPSTAVDAGPASSSRPRSSTASSSASRTDRRRSQLDVEWRAGVSMGAAPAHHCSKWGSTARSTSSTIRPVGGWR